MLGNSQHLFNFFHLDGLISATSAAESATVRSAIRIARTEAAVTDRSAEATVKTATTKATVKTAAVERAAAETAVEAVEASKAAVESASAKSDAKTREAATVLRLRFLRTKYHHCCNKSNNCDKTFHNNFLGRWKVTWWSK